MYIKHRAAALLLALCLSLPLCVPALGSGEPTEEPILTDRAEEEPAPPAAEAEQPLPAADGASLKENEQAIFAYLTGTMGFSTAAACGVLANIEKECSFNPNAGDSSTYGICQWHDWGSGVGRLTNLKNYCSRNGYDYKSLDGQLRFLQYELENDYPSILRNMRAYGSSAQEAYDAGYYWCYYFEAPASREYNSQLRGRLARDTYWPRYASAALCTVSFDSAGGTAADSVTVSVGSTLASPPTPTRTGYTFGGWFSQPNGAGERLTRVTVIRADATYYAWWTVNLYTVTLDPCGGSVSPGSVNVFYASTFGALPTPVRNGFDFAGWYTAAGDPVAGDSRVEAPVPDALYARWTPREGFSFVLRFDPNGGAGAPMPQAKTPGAPLTVSATKPQRRGYVFLGWALRADADSVDYAPGGCYGADADATLYAVWRVSLAAAAPSDAARALRCAGQDLPTADLDASGAVTPLDAAKALRSVVGLGQ